MLGADIKGVTNEAHRELDEKVEYLNHCLATQIGFESIQEDLNRHTDNFLEKLAEARGVSVDELRDSISKAKQQLSNAALLCNQIVQKNNKEKNYEPSEVLIKLLTLITDLVNEYWSLLSIDSRDELKKMAVVLLRVVPALEQVIADLNAVIDGSLKIKQKVDVVLETPQDFQTQSQLKKVEELQSQACKEEVLNKFNEFQTQLYKIRSEVLVLLIKIRDAGFRFISSISDVVDWIERKRALTVFNSMYIEIPEAEREQKNQELRELLRSWREEDINEQYDTTS